MGIVYSADTPLTVRQAINSQVYVDEGKTSTFQAFPAAPTQTEETFEDKVVIKIEDEEYEILPVSHKRVKVIRHFEESTPDMKRDIQDTYTGTEGTAHTPISVGRVSDRESLRTGVDDKKNVEASMALISGPRVTHDKELWEMLTRLRAPRQTVTIELPAGYSLTRGDQKKLKKLVDHITHDRLKPALELLTKIHPKIDEDKVIEEHPGLVSSFKHRLDALRN
jgi:hypothetical protein